MAFKAYNKEEILEQLKPYFLLGMSITKACETSGICDDQTILNWIKDDDTIRAKITGWQNYLSSKAREVWANKIQEEKDYQAAKDWLERKEKQEFSPRTEVENTGDLNINITRKIIDGTESPDTEIST